MLYKFLDDLEKVIKKHNVEVIDIKLPENINGVLKLTCDISPIQCHENKFFRQILERWRTKYCADVSFSGDNTLVTI